MKKLSFILVVMILSWSYGCQSDSKELNEQKDVSSGNELLGTNEIGDRAEYPSTPETESVSIDRSFENAPPLIPHTVQGMMVISGEHNECMLCHMPNKAEEKGATPLPQTHFTNYRPEIGLEGNLYQVKAKENEVVQMSTGEDLSMAMYNCNQCHVPQANITVEIENLFTPKFRESKSKNRSNLTDNIAEGVR